MRSVEIPASTIHRGSRPKPAGAPSDRVVGSLHTWWNSRSIADCIENFYSLASVLEAVENHGRGVDPPRPFCLDRLTIQLVLTI